MTSRWAFFQNHVLPRIFQEVVQKKINKKKRLPLTGWRHLLSLENTCGLNLTSFCQPTGSGLLRCRNHPLRESVAIPTTFTRQIILYFSSQFNFGSVLFFPPTIQLLWLCRSALLSAACSAAFAPLYRFPLGSSGKKPHGVVCCCAAPPEPQVLV